MIHKRHNWLQIDCITHIPYLTWYRNANLAHKAVHENKTKKQVCFHANTQIAPKKDVCHDVQHKASFQFQCKWNIYVDRLFVSCTLWGQRNSLLPAAGTGIFSQICSNANM